MGDFGGVLTGESFSHVDVPFWVADGSDVAEDAVFCTSLLCSDIISVAITVCLIIGR